MLFDVPKNVVFEYDSLLFHLPPPTKNMRPEGRQEQAAGKAKGEEGKGQRKQREQALPYHRASNPKPKAQSFSCETGT
jgi:hypothetical protein